MEQIGHWIFWMLCWLVLALGLIVLVIAIAILRVASDADDAMVWGFPAAHGRADAGEAEPGAAQAHAQERRSVRLDRRR